ncbi:MAG: hypothetical protein D6690_10430 [Nitrospirae bacterium]|nr:MAG: hypothetical protein D6690_10430 [Nitrospirota bacterium]
MKGTMVKGLGGADFSLRGNVLLRIPKGNETMSGAGTYRRNSPCMRERTKGFGLIVSGMACALREVADECVG